MRPSLRLFTHPMIRPLTLRIRADSARGGAAQAVVARELAAACDLVAWGDAVLSGAKTPPPSSWPALEVDVVGCGGGIASNVFVFDASDAGGAFAAPAWCDCAHLLRVC